MGKTNPINAYFKRKNDNILEADDNIASSNIDTPNLPISIINASTSESRLPKSRRIEVDVNSLERDPGLRRRIFDYHVDQRDKIRQFFINAGPFQPLLSSYPRTETHTKSRSFVGSWFKLHPSWLEYSPSKNATFCLPCYLFSPPSGNAGNTAFIVDGFQAWNKATGENGAFSNHVGKDLNSFHKNAQKMCENLMNQPQHIQRVVEKFNDGEIAANRLRVESSIEAIRYLVSHGIAFRGHDEIHGALNRGNFLDLLALMGRCNENIAKVVLDKAPKNVAYTLPQIQKEILHVFAMKVKRAICDEIGDAKFSIIVDEYRDEGKEQMSIILRFVSKEGLVCERFFGLVHVSNTLALTLKDELCSALSKHNLDIQSIRGQGYDGASNMRGEWNGLQALILRDCPYAYYVHCLAHRLQLALVAASKEVFPVFHFFEKLTFIVNVVGASCKRSDELKDAKAAEIEYLIAIEELETGSGLNQVGTLQRAGDTRWSSHLKSVSSLITMFSPTCEVLLNITEDGATMQDRGIADAAYEAMTTFEFVFILHLMKQIMEITDALCQALQCKSQDIVNAIRLISSTKRLLQKLRDEGLDTLLATVTSFCTQQSIVVPDMNDRYVPKRGRACHHQDEFLIGQYYRVDIFYAAIDSQLQELNGRFNEKSMELITLSLTLDLREHGAFQIDHVCQLVDKFYPKDFIEDEISQLKTQFAHYELNVVGAEDFKSLSSISHLCEWMVKIRRATTYHLVFRVIVLVLTLPVSTATAERSFSAMKIIKTKLRNKMEDDFLSDSSLIYIEREIASKFSLESILNDFRDLKERQVPF